MWLTNSSDLHSDKPNTSVSPAFLWRIIWTFSPVGVSMLSDSRNVQLKSDSAGATCCLMWRIDLRTNDDGNLQHRPPATARRFRQISTSQLELLTSWSPLTLVNTSSEKCNLSVAKRVNTTWAVNFQMLTDSRSLPLPERRPGGTWVQNAQWGTQWVNT